jgi:hypothetical protein
MTSQLMMFKETAALCSENHKKHTSLYDENAEISHINL